MRILVLSQWYAPEPAQLITGLAETLSKTGHDVTVLTGFPNYPTGKVYPGYRITPWRKETVDGIRIVRVPLFPSHDKSALKRVVNYVSFAFFATLLGPFLIRRPHVIHVYHPPLTTAVSGWLLSCLFRIPFTLEIQDLWPDSLTATGMMSNKRLLKVIDWTARWCYARATSVRVISEGMKTALEQRGVPSDKIRVIPNWTDECLCELPTSPTNAPKSGTSDAVLSILFAGNIGLAQALDNVLEAARLLRDEKIVEFLIVGDGVDKHRLQSIAREQQLTNVRFMDWQPRNEMPRLFAQADVLLVSLANNPLFQATIPHKVYSYMASGRPVLAIAQGDAADTVTSVNAGIACRPGDPAALVETVRRFHRMTVGERANMGHNGRTAIDELYSRGTIAAQIASWIQEVAKPK